MNKFILTFAILLASTSSAFAQIGSPAADLVYTPVTPCRVLDTRPSQGGSGAIAAAGTKAFRIWGATSYASQGGAPNNCGITAGSNVAAVAMNITVVTPAAGGFITAYPVGVALPTAATVNFQAGDIARGNLTLVKIAQTGVSHLNIYSSSNADVVGDVVGYYSKPVATALQCIDTVQVATPINRGPVNGLYFAVGIAPADCPAAYADIGVECFTNDPFAPVSKGAGGQCTGNSAVNTNSMFTSRRCCRIPGR